MTIGECKNIRVNAIAQSWRYHRFCSIKYACAKLNSTHAYFRFIFQFAAYTSSMITSIAASPLRGPILMMRV